MLTDSEKLAVCFVLRTSDVPVAEMCKSFAAICADYNYRGERMLELRDEIDALLRVRGDEIVELREKLNDAKEDLKTVRSLAESVVYKTAELTKANGCVAVMDSYEMKELKVELGIYLP